MRSALLLLLLAGCAAEQGPYPSLARRDIESVDLGEPQTPDVPAATDASTSAEAARLLAAAEAGDRAFGAAVGAATPAIDAGARAPAGSEAWVAAQEALSRVQAARLATADAVSALDEARLARGNAAPDAALDGAWRRAAALDQAQAARLSELAARLAEP